MRHLYIDIETFSSVDIKACGNRKYVESSDFEILLLSYAFDNADVICIDLANGEQIPEELKHAIVYDESTIIHAHNATFERLALNKFFNLFIPINKFRCSMAKAAYCGLPLSLEASGEALDLYYTKDKGGKELIKIFSVPCKPSKKNGGVTRIYAWDNPDKWEDYKKYNILDVLVERELIQTLAHIGMPESENEIYILDQEINDTGVKIDLLFAYEAANMFSKYADKLIEYIQTKYNIVNPKSDAQVKAWLTDKLGFQVKSLIKEDMPKLLELVKDDIEAIEVLEARNMLSKSSTAKYLSMLNVANADERARGLTQYYGANRTGRFAGRLIQLQNLPQNHIKLLELARSIVRNGDIETIEMMYGDVPKILSQLIRTAFIPEIGNKFAIADFSAIEARIVAYLANEKWRLDVFAGDGRIYEASASQMFGIPIELCGKGSEWRQKGKVAELAFGYGGSVNAYCRFAGIDKDKLTPAERKEIQALVDAWRKASPAIVDLWDDYENCAINAVLLGTPQISTLHNIVFELEGNWLSIKLPSGRKLHYANPRVEKGKWGRASLRYSGTDETTMMLSIDTYGGKLTENIVQAIARDCLTYAMLNIRNAGYPIVMHIHDEVVCEVPENTAKIDFNNIIDIMGLAIPWAPDLYLTADGFIADFYQKGD